MDTDVKSSRKFYQLMIAIITNLPQIATGISIPLTSVLLDKLEDWRGIHVTVDMKSLFASMLVFGSCFGSIFGGIQSQVLGRKYTLLTSIALSITGIVCMCFGTNFTSILIGQFINGYSIACRNIVIPVYTSEISQPEIRKITGSFFVTFHATGGALLFLLTATFHIQTALIIVLIMILVNLITVLFCPKSPTWLMSKGYNQEAMDILKRIRGNDNVAGEEMKRLEENIEKQLLATKKQEGMTPLQNVLHSIRQPTFQRPFLLLIVLNCVGVILTGGMVLPLYFIHILKEIKISKVITPYWGATATACWRLVVTIITTLVASKARRRPLFITSGFIALIGWLLLGLCTYFNENEKYLTFQNQNPYMHWLPFISMCIVMTGYYGGFIMVIAMLNGELLPSNLRGLGFGALAFVFNIINFLLSYTFPILEKTIQLYGIFFVFSCIMFLLLVFSYFFVPETFGLMLEEIEDIYRTEKQCKQDMDMKSRTVEEVLSKC